MIISDYENNMFQQNFHQTTNSPFSEALHFGMGGSCGNFLYGDSRFMFQSGQAYGTITPTKNKEDKNVSLIITIKSKNGIVIAGDSRNTITTEGRQYPAKNEVQKVFVGENFILGTCSNNTIAGYQIEDILNRLIEKYPRNYRKILRELQWMEKGSGEYLFCVGTKEYSPFCNEKCRYVQYIYSLKEFQLTETSVSGIVGYAYAGFNNFVPNTIDIDVDWSVEEMVSVCNDLLRHAINMGNKYLSYNPVGGHIKIAYLNDDGAFFV